MSDKSHAKVPHDKLIELVIELGADQRVIPYFEKQKRTYAMRYCPFLRSIAEKYGIDDDTIDLAFDIAIQRGWVIKEP